MGRVLTINDSYDGPRLGLAELRGVPHIYEAEFDHSSDYYGDTYFLSPIEPDLLALILEDWRFGFVGMLHLSFEMWDTIRIRRSLFIGNGMTR